MANILQKFFFFVFFIKKLKWHFRNGNYGKCRNYLQILLVMFFLLAEANGFGFVVHSHLNSALQLPQQCYEKGRTVLLS